MKRRLEGLWLMVAPAVGGAAVMAVELLGARLLAAEFGGSLAVWAAMISVALLALALGHYAGGWLADRHPTPRLASAAMLVAAAAVALVPRAGALLPVCADRLGVQWGALAASAALFLVPMGALGMVSPAVIRLLGSSGRLGLAAGGVYAVSTAGGVAGTLAAAFWLIPLLGVAAGFRLVAVMVALVGMPGLLLGRDSKPLPWLLAVLAAVVPPAAWPRAAGDLAFAPDGQAVRVEQVRDSLYGRIAVVRKGADRLLLLDGIVQTGMPADQARLEKGWGLRHRYDQELVPYLFDEPAGARALVIGLAGGLTPAILAAYGMDVECVELDPAVVETARRWFGFRGKVCVDDGRRFLRGCRGRYDCCILDVYRGETLPAHMVTIEALGAARAALAPEGVLVLHLLGAPRGAAFAAVHRTLGRLFAHVTAIGSEPGGDVQSITLFASSRPIVFNRGWLPYTADDAGVDPVSDAIERLRLTPPRGPARVLTDDNNPIDRLRAREVIRWRRHAFRIAGWLEDSA